MKVRPREGRTEHRPLCPRPITSKVTPQKNRENSCPSRDTRGREETTQTTMAMPQNTTIKCQGVPNMPLATLNAHRHKHAGGSSESHI